MVKARPVHRCLSRNISRVVAANFFVPLQMPKSIFPTHGLKRLRGESLRIADIVLSTTPQKISKAIRIATRSEISHAMVCVGPYSVIDATAAGVQHQNTQRLLFSARLPLYVLRYKLLTHSQALMIGDFVRAKVGTRYSVKEAIRAKAGRSREAGRKQFCSRLVAQAFAGAGIFLVPDPDYCTPDDLKNSALLENIEGATESVSEALFTVIEGSSDMPGYMSMVTNDALGRIRKLNPSIEDLNDAIQYLRANPKADVAIHAALQESGYLDAWRVEVDAKRWQYDHATFNQSKDSPREKQKYCEELIAQRQVHRRHHEANIVHLTEYLEESDLKTLRAMLEIDTRMTSLLDLRLEIAMNWLNDNGVVLK